ncbi:MAG: penicillin-binding transpeptidase domain-containing protein [Clostridiales bacterium]|nr:penicillin-binding transpeptidase domain-containing protein [Clostridiales bacterium]
MELAVAGAIICGGITYYRQKMWDTPEELLKKYMECISQKKYEKMYDMVNKEASGDISKEDFVKRNSAIYEGIEADNLKINVLEYDKKEKSVTYHTSFETPAGIIDFDNEASFMKGKKGYEIIWADSLIFPQLKPEDKVRINFDEAERGRILDRNGNVLAGKGTASSVGIVPEKLENTEQTVEKIAGLLETDPAEIEKKLREKWVKEDSFVPIKTIPKVRETELLSVNPDEEVLKEAERQKKLLEIPGIMITDKEIREYPLGKAASHLTGYVQNVTEEDLKEHEGEGYTETSTIGRTGMEALFEEELRGENGCRIYITDEDGKEKKTIASKTVQHGQDVKLTIDAELQNEIYEQFQEEKSCTAAMNPYTGEVLALVSTPSFDSNDFIRGLTEEEWKILNESDSKPMYNRFRQSWCPGSVFKPVTAAVGLESGALNPAEDYGSEGLSWQRDTTWGEYYVTTLHTCEPAVLENAMIYSDNIYFAKAALKIGAKELESALNNLGFYEELPFEIKMTKSSYSNTENIETEIQLADSGYGQGQILVNPLHMASIYTAFCNEGNMIKPHLLYKEDKTADYWIPEAFSKETAALVLEAMKKVISEVEGTGYDAYREDVVLAGKTGTAEIKASTEDTSGTELGWFCVFTAEKTEEKPVLLISMTEDVKERGGSGYVVEKSKAVLENWFS